MYPARVAKLLDEVRKAGLDDAGWSEVERCLSALDELGRESDPDPKRAENATRDLEDALGRNRRRLRRVEQEAPAKRGPDDRAIDIVTRIRTSMGPNPTEQDRAKGPGKG